MRTFVVFNPKAGPTRSAEAVRARLEARPGVTVCEPETPGGVSGCVAEAMHSSCDTLVAAGGDGTVHAVVNALAPDFDRCRLAVLPLGTGNDLCRTLALPEDALEALEALEALDVGRERRLDLMRVETAGRSGYAVNLASGGFSGQLQERLSDDLKATWGPLAYLLGAVGVLPDLTGYHTTLALDGGPPARVEALNIIVANGRYAAGGWRVASRADPEDGLLDVVVVRDGPLLDLTAVAARLLAGDYLDSDAVWHARARSVRVASEPGMWFSIDGELATNELVTFTAVPRALRVLVGPDYQAHGGSGPGGTQ
jgi:diacylglycerol kinase (ATP)